ncbi:DNA-binding HxlR family transcriptional regulator [Elusimicrobium posterum]|uniref:winged helix-turn-helix transcriptional regulator n=1 Tax=Elusimicrobium posterum TaxID=3116653 RepID=UPI003C7281B8
MKKKIPACPIEITLMHIGEKWKILILRELMPGTKRFGELKKSIGEVTQKVLTSNLRSMEQDGLLLRKIYAQVPPKVEYTLTDKGRSLCPVLNVLANWGDKYKEEVEV